MCSLTETSFLSALYCFCFAEAFFQPNSTDTAASGIHDTCFPSIMKGDFDIRKVFVRQCRAVRWTAMFQGTGKRFFFRTDDLGPIR